MKPNRHEYPPVAAKWLLKRLTEYNDRHSIIEDSDDTFKEILSANSITKAQLWYWKNTVKTLIEYIKQLFIWSFPMLKNYVKIAFRNIKRQKGYSFINIAGLATGLTCCIYILLYIQLHLSYDNYHKDLDRLYSVGVETNSKNGNYTSFANFTPAGPILREKYPEIESVSRRSGWSRPLPVKYGEILFYEQWVNYAESEIFDIFTIPFLKGDPVTALDRPKTAVITEEIAEKYFGVEDPIGKTLLIETTEYEITGVIENAPRNTFLNYKIYMSWKDLEEMPWSQGWRGRVTFVNIRLKPGIDPVEFEQKISNLPHEYNGEEFSESSVEHTFFLQPVKDIHLFARRIEGISENLLYLYIYIIVGVFVLLIACMNFTNLSTARSIKRSLEVGMRKVAGANRGQLMIQFIGESLLTTMIAFLFALVLVIVFMPLYNDLAGMQFRFSDLLKINVILGIMGLIIFIGVLAGSYPAFFLSSLKPSNALKGSMKAGSRSALMRKYLVIGQFAISIVLIIGTLTVYSQIDFMRNKQLGFDKEQKLVVTLQGWRLITDNYENVKGEFARHSSVLHVSAASGVPGKGINNTYIFPTGEEKENNQSPMSLRCDHDFIQGYNITVLAGRQFDPALNADITGQTLIINESLVKAFGWSSPEEAVGKTIGDERIEVIGVISDFHWYGLQAAIDPLMMRYVPGLFKYITMTINTENLPETLEDVEDTYKELFPGQLFEYFFVDENFDLQYRNEERLGKIFSVFSLFGIFIACLGLFGLASFIAEQRSKEIGIRKVLGSSVTGVIYLLSKELCIWVLLSNIIAFPVAYYIVFNWLQNFAYANEIQVGVFVTTSLITLLVAMLTVAFNTRKIACKNPVDSLKYE